MGKAGKYIVIGLVAVLAISFFFADQEKGKVSGALMQAVAQDVMKPGVDADFDIISVEIEGNEADIKYTAFGKEYTAHATKSEDDQWKITDLGK